MRTIDLTKSTATGKRFEYRVSIDCAYSLLKWCNDDTETYYFKLYARNVLEASATAIMFFEEMIGDGETPYLARDIVRMDVQRIGD